MHLTVVVVGNQLANKVKNKKLYGFRDESKVTLIFYRTLEKTY